MLLPPGRQCNAMWGEIRDVMRSWCGAAVGKREITKLFQVVVVAGRGGGRGGAAAGLQRYPLGALRKLRYLDIGHRGNEQYLILSFTLFYLDMCMQIMSAIFIIILDIPGCV